ncbi:hypothetical protein [Winogradskyella sp.]|uniref:hypothetical protein n=1 Tax=Winogradskyella sp. TaxID=1883156 RepID=UPI00261A6984|nr:hypothetical protein [Winogradskyella sp.]
MKRIGLKKFNVISKEQLKSILAGEESLTRDGFDCAWYYQRCDRMYPDNYDMFSWCMRHDGCA